MVSWFEFKSGFNKNLFGLVVVDISNPHLKPKHYLELGNTDDSNQQKL
jgi:hypothetical protein